MNNKGPLIIILFIGVVAIVGLAAFLASKYLPGNGGGTTTGTIEINYMGLWDVPEIYAPLIAEYEGTHPNVKIKYTRSNFGNTDNLTYKGVYQTNAEERFGNGTQDIIRVHQSWVPRLVASGLLSPAPDDMMTAAQAKDLYYDAVYTSIAYGDGKVYASPQIIDGLVLIYNKELFANAGITDPRAATKDWDATLQTAKKITQLNDNKTIKIAGINMGSVGNVTSSPEIFIAMLTQSDIPVVGKSNNQLTASFANDKVVAAINRYYEFSRLQTWSPRLSKDFDAFVNGKLAMMIAPSWKVNDIVQYNSNLRFDTLPIPTLPGANVGVPQYYASFWVDAVSKKSKHPKESWEFLNWLSQPEQMRRIYKAQTERRLIGNPYPRKDMATEQKDAPYIAAIIEMAPTMKSWPLYDIGVWESVIRTNFIQFDDQGIIGIDELNKVQNQINQLTFQKK